MKTIRLASHAACEDRAVKRIVLIATLSLTVAGCSRSFRPETAAYRVIERLDKHANKAGVYVSEDQPYDHDEVYLALGRGKVRIYGRCRGSCDMQPEHDYACTSQPNGIDGALPPIPKADLLCKDGGGRSVFVHALSQQ